jgi:hypothetical protein
MAWDLVKSRGDFTFIFHLLPIAVPSFVWWGVAVINNNLAWLHFIVSLP